MASVVTGGECHQKERRWWFLAGAEERRLLEAHFGWEPFHLYFCCYANSYACLYWKFGDRQTKIHNIGATVIGVDKFGNKYYEKLGDTQYGRHCWVEYAEKGRYNASQVPREWHGWLHFITDHTGDELLMLRPKSKKYGVAHRENLFGEGEDQIYHSKGHALNPGQKNLTRYQFWEPAKNE